MKEDEIALKSPCVRSNCSPDTIASCCGCPEWFRWKSDADTCETSPYKGKHERSQQPVNYGSTK